MGLQGPSTGASHKECWEWREAAVPTTKKKGKRGRDGTGRGGGGQKRHTGHNRTGDGTEMGVVNPGVLGKC